MPDSLTIRQATLSDILHVCDLDQAAFAPYGTAESAAVISARFRIFPDGFLIAEHAGQIVGYASSEKWLTLREPQIDERPEDSHHADGKVWCITAMAVKREFQREGIGASLLKRTIELAQAHLCHEVVLETSNARAFYIKHGFAEVQRRMHGSTRLFVMARVIGE